MLLRVQHVEQRPPPLPAAATSPWPTQQRQLATAPLLTGLSL